MVWRRARTPEEAAETSVDLRSKEGLTRPTCGVPRGIGASTRKDRSSSCTFPGLSFRRQNSCLRVARFFSIFLDVGSSASLQKHRGCARSPNVSKRRSAILRSWTSVPHPVDLVAALTRAGSKDLSFRDRFCWPQRPAFDNGKGACFVLPAVLPLGVGAPRTSAESVSAPLGSSPGRWS